MNFNKSISGINAFTNHPLWQAAENYLRVGNKTYQVRMMSENTMVLEAKVKKTNFVLLALKMFSYISIALPVGALIIKHQHRKKHTFKIIELASQVPPEKRNAAVYKACLETFSKKNEDVLGNVFTQLKPRYSQHFFEAKKELDESLQSCSTYFQSQDNVIQNIHSALQGILDHPRSQEKIDHARNVYKALAFFLRAHTNEASIPVYRDYMEKNCFFDGVHSIHKPSCYLLQGESVSASEKEKHVVVLFLLKKLRRQIKLASKHDKIASMIENSAEIQEISQEVVKKALAYLNLSWLHGTKANVIKSACEKTNNKLLCVGALRQLQVQTLSGELREGAGVNGINQRFLSGVGLSSASRSIKYAKSFSFDLEAELSRYQQFLTTELSFKTHRDFLDAASLGRTVEALKRIKKLQPETFEQDKELIIKKIAEIRAGIQKMFDENANVLFARMQLCYGVSFYNYMKSFEELESIFGLEAEVIDPEDQELAKIGVVVASKNRQGITYDLNPAYEESEEVYMGGIELAKEAQVLFVRNEDLSKVQALVQAVGLEEVTVESMDVLKAASKMDQILAPYFYDVYNIRKWKTAV
ncbi:putative uncharacterized protein [Parachlamydia acanthamoebae UV-7]|uniref:Uncharacterized protein n=2 Tax=Parachlamydia acanthamoebae TaxID=83552 RepID=F8KWH9_PARAV|nr:hypothetical protein [Parachlamydia acanthamoebae]CCB85377.1 putative uncharacterized protein [Parachlamydia acanthamoebae UV-7]